MKRLFAFVLLLAGSLQAADDILRLGPVPVPSQPPKVCMIISVIPDSSAEKAGLKSGDVVHAVNGQVPGDASQVADLVKASPKDMTLSIRRGESALRLPVVLNESWPRLGAVCDLSGWRKGGVSAAGNESVTVFQGPYALTVSGIIDKKIVNIRVRISNHSAQPLEVSPQLFSAQDGKQSPLTLLTPGDVMTRLHGDMGARLMNGSEGKSVESGEKGSSNIEYALSNAEYLRKEALKTVTLKPAETADGLVFFSEPAVLPLQLSAKIAGQVMDAALAQPQPPKAMPRKELVQFLKAQKKGTALRLALRSGKVFVGRFSTYDSDNELVWFDTPSGSFLNTTSFALTKIAGIQPVDQKPTEKTSVSEHFQ